MGRLLPGKYKNTTNLLYRIGESQKLGLDEMVLCFGTGEG